MIGRAELLADRGEAAAGSEFFRSRPFLDAEGVTHTLRIEAEADGRPLELLAPLIVREIDPPPGTPAPEPLRDAISPYGYPGLTPPGSAVPFGRIPAKRNSGTVGALGGGVVDPAEIDWRPTGLVSIFLRHALGEPPLAGTTERNVVQIADPALPRKSRPGDRRQVRRNLEAGYRTALVPGPDTEPEQRAGFLAVYEQTMRRAGAAERYFFGATYFDRILEAEGTWLALAYAPDGDLAAASIAAVADGYLHYYLSGSADSRLRESPMKNVVTLLVEHAAEVGLPLNLGGGIRPGDALEEFKRGFANRQLAWRTSELVCDPERYAALSPADAPDGFFPAYRA